ncbi:biotin/lipoyl-containing protein [Bacteroides heparinolyticus]|uniref:biotin/lipoyl-containing protein n=1 Tax=Prevotella heparinolytica TaxID=28113 RepID=UPI002A9D755D|nr:biotin/lipoyl-containing protein [Prevotella sp.]
MKEYKYTINGKEYEVAIGDVVDNIANVTVNGVEYKVEMEPEPEPEKVVVRPVAQPTESEEAPANKANVNTADAVKAPLPGVVIEIKVAVGDEVKEGDTVVVLEAMKMANNLEANKSGKVVAVCVKAGESVMEDTPLVVIE